MSQRDKPQLALNNITAGVREREDANRTREAGHLDEIQGALASTLKLFRNGAVGFIDWLGSVLSIGFDDLCRASGNLDDKVPFDIHRLPVCGSVPLPVEAGAGCLG